MCNVLVCLAVWLAAAGHSVTDKILGIIFPISAFVAAGFEHSVANMYFLPLGVMLDPSNGLLSASAIAHNLIAVTLGNIVDGSVLAAAVYHVIYSRALPRE